MAKEEQMLRLQYIQDILRSKKEKGASYQDIKSYLEKKFEEKDLGELKFTERTFQRDKKAILKVTGIEISYSRSRDIYYISEEELTNAEESVLDNLLLIEAYRQTKSNSDIMIFEPRKARGLNHLNGIIHAIQNRKILGFTYHKFWTDETSERIVEPYALKEFQHRWYLLANEHNKSDFLVKTFALDRIQNLDIKSSSFVRQKFDLGKTFENSFGIISTEGKQPMEIVLSFTWEQGNYTKSLPLHHSQTFVKEENDRTYFKYLLVPTYDFFQEILWHGQAVKVEYPEVLVNQIEYELKECLKQY